MAMARRPGLGCVLFTSPEYTDSITTVPRIPHDVSPLRARFDLMNVACWVGEGGGGGCGIGLHFSSAARVLLVRLLLSSPLASTNQRSFAEHLFPIWPLDSQMLTHRLHQNVVATYNMGGRCGAGRMCC